MKENLTEIVFIVDRSGSMYSIAPDVIGGYNSFLKEQQKQPGEAFVTTALFDHEYVLLNDAEDISTVAELTSETFVPRGSTALFDAIGRTINTIGERLSNTEETERPESILFVIITDGAENCSTEFTQSQIKEMIKRQEDKYSWDFTFIAANMDATSVGMDYGVAAHKTLNFSADGEGVRKMSDTLSTYTTSYRSSSRSCKSSISLSDVD